MGKRSSRRAYSERKHHIVVRLQETGHRIARDEAGSFRVAIVGVLAVGMLLVAFAAGAMTTWFLAPEIRQRLDPAPGAPAALATQEAAPTREELAEILWEAWDILEREFIHPEELVAEEMMRGAIRGVVQTLDDPYTSYVDPIPAAIMDEDMQGSFEGIGASVRMEGDRLIIEQFLPGSPGREAGLRVGDAIVEVDGEPLAGLTVIDAIARIRGPEGSVVRLLVQREGAEEPFVVPVRRARIEFPTLEARMLPEGIGYLGLAEFNAVADARVSEALEELLAEHPGGLILDLRDNPGGYFQSAVDVTSQFLPRGALVVSETQRGEEPTLYEVERDGLATDIALVVLVNGGSASASEIVAGALRDHDRATLVGERTFGKGSVQTVHTLQDGSSLRVTVARYYLPDGGNVDGDGITPDVEVSYTQEDHDAGRDPQLDRAIRYLSEGE